MLATQRVCLTDRVLDRVPDALASFVIIHCQLAVGCTKRTDGLRMCFKGSLDVESLWTSRPVSERANHERACVYVWLRWMAHGAEN